MRYLLYVTRWALLAIPGAWFYRWIQAEIPEHYSAMIISQALLGMAVFWVDRAIFGEKRRESNENNPH